MQMKREMLLDMAGGGIPASFSLLLHSSVSSVFTTCCFNLQDDEPFFPPSCHPYFLSLIIYARISAKTRESKGPFCHSWSSWYHPGEERRGSLKRVGEGGDNDAVLTKKYISQLGYRRCKVLHAIFKCCSTTLCTVRNTTFSAWALGVSMFPA